MESSAEALARLRRSLRRVARADFLRDEATEAERARLLRSVEPVTTRVAQDYAAWRRPILWVAAAATLANVCLELFGYDTVAMLLPKHMLVAIGLKNVTLMEWLARAPMMVGFLGSLLVLAAAVFWRRVRVSVQLARSGWLLMFATPFLLAILPYARLLDLDHLDAALREPLRTAIGAGFALSIFISVGPRTLALFPGIIRSSLALKTMLPEAPVPGWTVALAGPLVFVSGIIQAQGSFFLLGGVACLMLSPIVYVFRRKSLIRPQSGEDAAKLVQSIKRQVRLVSFAGLTLVSVFMLRRPNVGVLQVLGFLTGVIGNVVLLTVVGADFILGVLRSAHWQNKAFEGSPLQASLVQKLEELEGLGDVPKTLKVSADASTVPHGSGVSVQEGAR